MFFLYQLLIDLGTIGNVISVIRLHSVGRIHSQSMLLCIAIHGSKLPLCLSMALPFTQTASVLLPSIALMSPSTLMFLFTFVVSKIIEAPKDLTLNEVGVQIIIFILCTCTIIRVFLLHNDFLSSLEFNDQCSAFANQQV